MIYFKCFRRLTYNLVFHKTVTYADFVNFIQPVPNRRIKLQFLGFE